MNDNQFQDRFENEGSSDLERRLREFQPTPPQTSWEDIERSMSFDRQVTVQPSRASGWWKMATHAAAAFAGVALGVVLMLSLNADGSTKVVLDSDVAEQVVEEPIGSGKQKTMTPQNELFADQRRNVSARNRGVFRPTRAIRRGPLTPLHRDIDLHPWRNASYDQLTSSAEPSSSSITPSDFVKPMTAPQLLRQLLDEQSEMSNHRQTNPNSG